MSRNTANARRAASSHALRAVMLGAAMGLSAAPALAGTDVIIRQQVPFDACVDVQDRMMTGLGVAPETLAIEMDTGAMLMRKYSSLEANLVLVCNRVTDVLEVRRETPGDLATAGKE